VRVAQEGMGRAAVREWDEWMDENVNQFSVGLIYHLLDVLREATENGNRKLPMTAKAPIAMKTPFYF